MPDILIPELPPVPVKPISPLPMIGIERAASARELALWQRLIQEHRKACNTLDIAGLLLKNIYITYAFAKDNGVFLAPFPPDLEDLYYQARESFEKSKAAIRAVKDRRLGIRVTGNDLDIMQPNAEQSGDFGALIIPVIIGIVIVAGAIAAAVYQTKTAIKISNDMREIVRRTDKTLCSDPASPLCEKWKAEKQVNGYTKNESLIDTIKAGVSKVSGGIGVGLLIALPLAAWLLFGRGKR